MNVSAEHIVTILRCHVEGGFGSPSVFEVLVTRFGNEASLMIGRAESYTPEISRAIRAKLRELGITKARFVRMNKAAKHEVVVVEKINEIVDQLKEK